MLLFLVFAPTIAPTPPAITPPATALPNPPPEIIFEFYVILQSIICSKSKNVTLTFG